MGVSVCAKKALSPSQSQFSPGSPSAVVSTRFFGHSPWQVKSHRHARHWPVVARSAGALFIRSYERGERVHLAMVSRGHGLAVPKEQP